jgi:Transposase DDE domain group 1
MKPISTQGEKAKTLEFSNLGRRTVQGSFDAGSMTGDAGVLLLAETDRRLGLTQAAAKCIADPRNPLLITHSVLTQIWYAAQVGVGVGVGECAICWTRRYLTHLPKY